MESRKQPPRRRPRVSALSCAIVSKCRAIRRKAWPTHTVPRVGVAALPVDVISNVQHEILTLPAVIDDSFGLNDGGRCEGRPLRILRIADQISHKRIASFAFHTCDKEGTVAGTRATSIGAGRNASARFSRMDSAPARSSADARTHCPPAKVPVTLFATPMA